MNGNYVTTKFVLTNPFHTKLPIWQRNEIVNENANLQLYLVSVRKLLSAREGDHKPPIQPLFSTTKKLISLINNPVFSGKNC